MIALEVERASLVETLGRHVRMLAHERVAKRREVAIVLPARVRHHPIEIVQHARDEEVGVALRGRQRRVDGETIFAGDVGDDRLAVAQRFAVIDDVGKLAARRRGRVEDVLVPERHARQLEEGIDLEAVAVVVGDPE